MLLALRVELIFSNIHVMILKGTMNEGNVEVPPLTDSHNNICSVSFAGFR